MHSLFEAVRQGDEAKARELLAAGADVNELGPERKSPLIEAAAQGAIAMVQLLLEAGAEPAWKDDLDETALLKAAANGHRAAYELLWPLADDQERGMARAFLSASGQRWDESPPAPTKPAPGFQQKLGRAVATAASRVSKFVGHEDPSNRMERVERAEDAESKKRR